MESLGKAAAAASLSAEARRLHQLILSVFAATGAPPTAVHLARWLTDGIDVSAGLGELDGAADLVIVGTDGEYRAAYPFSPRPTGIEVSWEGGGGAHVMCAIDALGVAAMLDAAATITTFDLVSNDRITVRVHRTGSDWQRKEAVVLTGAVRAVDGCCPSVDRTCTNIRFFAQARTAQLWQQAHLEVEAEVLDQQTALAAAAAEFGSLMGTV